jgi:hypothetical protein
VDVDNIPVTTAHESSKPQWPSPITMPLAQAASSHSSLLEFLSEMIFEGQHKCALDMESVVVVSASSGTQQTLRATRAETLDDPKNPNAAVALRRRPARHRSTPR